MTHFKNGKPTNFVAKIIYGLQYNFRTGHGYVDVAMNDFIQACYANGILEHGWMKTNFRKLHTLREDKSKRWKVGMLIHFKIWTGKPYKSKTFQFAPLVPCLGIQEIKIYTADTSIGKAIHVEVDGRYLEGEEIKVLAKNDGFDSLEDFCEFFSKGFSGRIIHWTPLKY